MGTNTNSLLEYESGVTPVLMSALTDSGDHKVFNTSVSLLSESNGNAPDVRPNGLITDGQVTAAIAGGNDTVDVTAATLYIGGALIAAAADLDVTITRPATNVSKVNSITIDALGAVVVVAGTDGGTTAFSETRGAAGGPPLIPVDHIEIAQVRVTSSTAAPITADQIFATVGTHRERFDYPAHEIDYANGKINFDSAMPAIHTGPAVKGIYASYASPVFTEQKYSNDYVPVDTNHSVSSTQVYGGTVGSSSSSLGQGSFTAILKDGITDGIIGKKNDTLWFRFYQDRNKTAHSLTRGKLGIGRTFNAASNPQVKCTISATEPTVDRAS